MIYSAGRRDCRHSGIISRYDHRATTTTAEGQTQMVRIWLTAAQAAHLRLPQRERWRTGNAGWAQAAFGTAASVSFRPSTALWQRELPANSRRGRGRV